MSRTNNSRRTSDSKQLVSIKGLSGWKTYYEVSTGQLLSEAENEEWEVGGFFPLQIEHFMLARASDTKQPTSPKYAENPVAVDDALKTSLKSRKKTAEFQELNSILEFVDSVHEVTKVVGIAFHDPLQITEFTNIHQSGRGGLRLQDNRQTGQSTTQFNHHPLQSTISTSLTVAGSGFRTIGRLVTTTSINYPL
ncbi:hypothetical protein N7527_011100 [Penicillium freii]|nr:hypothetical protein N7527_011100 [Penicillium freii]